MPKLHLTDKSLKALRTSKPREEFWDQSLPGFVVRVFSSGQKNFELVYRSVVGRRARFKIGDAKLMPLADARQKARELLVAVQQGQDPASRRRDQRVASTFKQLSDSYLEFHCRPNLRPRSVKDVEYTLKSELLPAWGHRKVVDIRRADIIQLIERIGVGRKAPVRANHVRATISGIFNFAIQREIVESSPCVGLPRKYREVPRERVLSDDEIVAFWTATALEEPVIRDLFRVLLLLGQRSGETRMMQWSQINDGVWTIPAALTKNKREHQVPLPARVLEILDRHRGNGEFVFTSRLGEPIQWIQKASYRIRKSMKSTPWSPHDLRRTCSTGLEKLGFSEAVIGAVINHTKIGRIGVTGRYTQHDFLEERRKALAAWSKRVDSICNNVKPSYGSGKVLKMRG